MLLQLGDKGDNVKYLQYGLHILCCSPNGFDGDFGNGTLTAVKKFQSKYGLVSDGIVGDVTWNTLKNEIATIQAQLNKKGCSVGTVDGIAGPTTYNAVISFQNKNGLTADGQVGTATWDILFDTVSGGTTYTRILKVTSPLMYGEDIKAVQNKLNSLGYNCGTADGYYGNATKSAVISFQSAKGLTADGEVGPATWNALFSSSSTSTGSSYTRLLKVTSPLMYGEDIKAVQNKLNSLGHNCGTADGYYGNATKSAVVSFQSAKGIDTDGVVGPTTWNALFNSSSSSGSGTLPGGPIKVFIDAGHGDTDPGAVGNGLKEKNIVLNIATKLGALLNGREISIKYSRTNDTYLSLEDRARLANAWGADLFVSIHANSATSSVRGAECYTHPTANTATKTLSANISRAIASKLGIPNRGHKEANFAVLRLSNMPAILVETAFISNSSDANLLNTRKDDFASAIFNEIYTYLGKPVTNISLINELASLAVRYCSMNSLLGIKSINKCILDYLRHVRYDDSEWKLVVGDISPFVEYIKTNYISTHNKLLPYIQNDPKMFNFYGETIDLAHLAATTLGYINSLLDYPPSIAVPNFWTGWGGDLATAMADITKIKKEDSINQNKSEQYIADTLVIGKASSCSDIDIKADIDAISFSSTFTTERFDISFNKFYQSVSASKRKKLFLKNDFNLPETTNLDVASSAIEAEISGLRGFYYPVFGDKLLNKATYNKIEPTSEVKTAACKSFAKYLFNSL